MLQLPWLFMNKTGTVEIFALVISHVIFMVELINFYQTLHKYTDAG